MNTKYRLLKDLPDSKAGDIYVFHPIHGAYYKNGDKEDSYWMPEHVENNPEWFELEKLYTIEDMRKCFQAARQCNPTNKDYPTFAEWKYRTYDDYLKTLNK